MKVELIAEVSSSARFWGHVAKSPDCWVWTAYRNHDGYGRFWLNGKSVTASRYSYELENGPIPGGLIVCHRCDTPACVRPDHLFLGTQADNISDAFSKGRKVAPAGRYAGRTHCERGHELAGYNLAIVGTRRTRRCRACNVERTRQWRARRAG